MKPTVRTFILFGLVALLIVGTGILQGWDLALVILNMGLVSAIMSLGVNLQWGIAGLFNVGVMGFVALGGLAVVLTSVAPVPDAWSAGGLRAIGALVLGAAVMTATVLAWKRTRNKWLVIAILIVGFVLYRMVRDPAVDAIEAVDPAGTGFLGGLGLPVVFSWFVGGLLAAGAAWIIGKTALGLRSDYLAIATLGISEIIIAILKNEEWLSRGVKNVNGLPRPVPREIDLQTDPGFIEKAASFGLDPVSASTLYVKISYGLMFAAVLIVLLVLAQLALNSPWGRMMRAIRDNEVSARAMGKDVTFRHLQVFVLGSAICGIAGAMMTTLDGLLIPTSYQPLRYTFLIWVMVIVGGSGNNLGAVLGGFLIWFLWVQVEVLGPSFMTALTQPLPDGSFLKEHLRDSVQHMRLLTMGVILLVVLRFSPRGLLPER
ncbi:branched-chain amino acid ABC transporter permease [Ponticoccus alexandrii]|uniref:Branched-chain amino acid ABC transporter permease n=1 Tax=Ponticoccus alexandrii TaxID=1943633 RepID=A0ABX7F7F8_9RHOB|nr:branched-chain amino acid ABC transporter permease [Ponticoccus alexandrii]ETA50435.1 branched-chain amino acid ABC transporter permease [Rhodobacteraceae bacterium PD-2]QRF66197.1 branched-chain amino acid ABC transporter permease [Ponticoccus alexandrii]